MFVRSEFRALVADFDHGECSDWWKPRLWWPLYAVFPLHRKLPPNNCLISPSRPICCSQSGQCTSCYLCQVGFYTVVAFMTMTFLFWSAFEIPKSVVAADSMAYGLMAENSVSLFHSQVVGQLPIWLILKRVTIAKWQKNCKWTTECFRCGFAGRLSKCTSSLQQGDTTALIYGLNLWSVF